MNSALTTAFVKGRAPALTPREIIDLARRAGAGALVIDRHLPVELGIALDDELRRSADDLPVLALEAPARSSRGNAPELCAPDRDEARAALEATLNIIRRAGAHRARFVVVSLGQVRAVADDWVYARERFLRGQLDEVLTQRLLQARQRSAASALDAARRALEPLARACEAAGCVLLLRNGRRYVELPMALELDQLRADLRGAPLGALCDVAAAHLVDLMGFAPLSLTLTAFAGPLCYFGDACGPIGALAPGRGIVDLRAVQAALGAETAVAFSPWPGLSLEEVVAALSAVELFTAR